MPVVFGVGRGFGFFTATGQQIGNFIRRITYPYSGNHYPTDVFFGSDEKIYISGVGENDTQSYGILTKRDGIGGIYNKEIFTTNDTTFDTGYNGLDIDSSGNIYAAGFTFTNATDVYPVITKFDANGDIIWNRYHSSTAGKICTNINISANGTIYVCGGDYAGTGGVEGNFVAAYTSTGTCSWNRYITDSSGTYTNFSFVDIKSMSDNSVIVVGYFTGNKKKSIITKYDSSGNLVWNKTLELYGSFNTFINQVHIDSSNQIYVVGETSEIATPYNSRSFVAKFTAEGNLLWQNQSPVSTTQYFSNTGVTADDEVGSVYTIGVFKATPASNKRLCITKYDENGLQVFRRVLRSNIDTVNDINYPNIFATNTDLYISFVDQANNNSICYGRVSVSGNGVGEFEYPDGSSVTFFYSILGVTDVLGTLFDGSVMNLSSDFTTYPFSATKIVLDDLAGIYTDKRIVSEAAQEVTSSSYGTTNAYALLSSDKIVYGSNLLINYDFENKASYPGTGTSISNLSSTSYTSTVYGSAVFNSSGYFNFDGTNDYIEHATNSFPLTGDVAATLECWIYYTTTFNSPYPTEAILAYGNAPSTGDTIALGLFDDHRLGMFFNGGTNIGTLGGAMTAYKNTWCHVVGTKSPGSTGTPGGTQTISLYVNGSQLTLGTWASPITPNVSSRVIRLGRWTNDSAPLWFNGRMGEARIYNRVLTSVEVSQNFEATRAKYGV